MELGKLTEEEKDSLEAEPTTVDDLIDQLSAHGEGIKHMKTHIVLPFDGIECDRVDILVEDKRQRDSEVEHVEALGPDVVRQNLDGVRYDERREGKTNEQAVS